MTDLIDDVIESLEALRNIKRPRSDNEGDALNHPDVQRRLPPEDQNRIAIAVNAVREFVIESGIPNKRRMKALSNRGYPTHLNTDQYDQDRLVGSVLVNEHKLDISDPELSSSD